MEIIVIFLLFGGGVLAALIFMIIATKGCDRLIRSLIYSSLAFGCLFAQRSCWQAASDFGRSTGGSGGQSGVNAIETCMLFWGVWTVMLIGGYFIRQRLHKKPSTVSSSDESEDMTLKDSSDSEQMP